MRFKTTAKDGERGGSSDMRRKTVPQTSGCNRKRSVADSGQTSTSNVQRPDIAPNAPIHSAGVSTAIYIVLLARKPTKHCAATARALLCVVKLSYVYT